MRVLGLDLSTTATGWAVFDNEKLLDYGVLNPYSELDDGAKIYYIANSVAGLIKVFKPDDLSVEDTFYGTSKNYPTLRKLVRLCGAIYYVWFSFKGKDPNMYMAVSARPSLEIKGNAQKEEVTAKVNEVFFSRKHEANKLKDDNIADAIVVAYHHFKVKSEEKEQNKKAYRKRKQPIEESEEI